MCSALGASTDTLVKQLNIKHQHSQQPVIEKMKSKVEQKHLGEYMYVMTSNIETSFKNMVEISKSLNKCKSKISGV